MVKQAYANLLTAAKTGRLPGESDSDFANRITLVFSSVVNSVPGGVQLKDGAGDDNQSPTAALDAVDVAEEVGDPDIVISDGLLASEDIAADVHDAIEDIQIRKQKVRDNLKLAATTLFAAGAAAAGPGGAAAVVPILTGALAKIQ